MEVGLSVVPARFLPRFGIRVLAAAIPRSSALVRARGSARLAWEPKEFGVGGAALPPVQPTP